MKVSWKYFSGNFKTALSSLAMADAGYVAFVTLAMAMPKKSPRLKKLKITASWPGGVC